MPALALYKIYTCIHAKQKHASAAWINWKIPSTRVLNGDGNMPLGSWVACWCLHPVLQNSATRVSLGICHILLMHCIFYLKLYYILQVKEKGVSFQVALAMMTFFCRINKQDLFWHGCYCLSLYFTFNLAEFYFRLQRSATMKWSGFDHKERYPLIKVLNLQSTINWA